MSMSAVLNCLTVLPAWYLMTALLVWERMSSVNGGKSLELAAQWMPKVLMSSRSSRGTNPPVSIENSKIL